MSDFDWSFFAEVLVGGLLSGVMYSLVAIGFVLIYKASGVLNFAQGAMLLFAALTFVSLVERGVPFAGALAITFAVMIGLGIAIERAVLRPLVNKPPITLFMATLAVSYILEGAAQLLWGTQVHALDLGIDDTPFQVGGLMISRFDLFAAAVAASLVALLTLFFGTTRTGLSFRAVADDQLAALATGLRVGRIWSAVWATSGLVALVAGLMWGARLGVQFSLSFVVLKALPVLVLGGFDSIAGAIVGGLIIGAGEKVAEVYLGPVIGSGIEGWFAYALALAILLVRPGGLFGQKLVERFLMSDIALRQLVARGLKRPLAPAAILIVAFGILPFIGTAYLFEAVLVPFLILSLAGLGLNVLTGYAGQLSLGTAAFMAVGAYSAFNLNLRLGNLPLLVDIGLAGLVTAAVGLVFGLPSLRLRGFYLAVSTLAAQFLVPWVLTRFSWLSNDSASGIIAAPPLRVAGVSFDSPVGRYLFVLTIVAAWTAFVAHLAQNETGENLIAVRDNERAARIIGVPVLRTKLFAFVVSSFIIGVAGALWAFAFLRTVEPAGFNLDRSFQILFIIIIGGLASIRGAFFGAALIVAAPIALSRLGEAVLGARFDSGTLDMSQRILLGVLILVFLIAEPRGLVALWDRLVRAVARRFPLTSN